MFMYYSARIHLKCISDDLEYLENIQVIRNAVEVNPRRIIHKHPNACCEHRAANSQKKGQAKVRLTLALTLWSVLEKYFFC